MTLKDKLLDPALPVTFFEMVPPAANKPGALEASLEEATRVKGLVEAINLPEIHDEVRGSARTAQFVERIEPRWLGARIRQELGIDVVINRCVARDPDPVGWFYLTQSVYGISDIVLVGGESSRITYPGPSVKDAAQMISGTGLPATLGGISLPGRPREPERVRQKHQAGLAFFTTQVLFDSNDIVWLIQKLNGVNARIFLSFVPVSHPRDLQFLRWLGVDLPQDLDRYLLQDGGGSGVTAIESSCFGRSLDLAQRILMDVFENLPPDPPAIGLNIEHINKRNLEPAIRMVEELGSLYANLVVAALRSR